MSEVQVLFSWRLVMEKLKALEERLEANNPTAFVQLELLSDGRGQVVLFTKNDGLGVKRQDRPFQNFDQLITALDDGNHD